MDRDAPNGVLAGGPEDHPMGQLQREAGRGRDDGDAAGGPLRSEDVDRASDSPTLPGRDSPGHAWGTPCPHIPMLLKMLARIHLFGWDSSLNLG